MFLNSKSVATVSMDKCEQMDLQFIIQNVQPGASGLPLLGNTTQSCVILTQTEREKKKLSGVELHTCPASILDDTTYKFRDCA